MQQKGWPWIVISKYLTTLLKRSITVGGSIKNRSLQGYFYDEYSNRTITIGYTGDGEIFDIRSYNQVLGTFPIDEIFSSIGKPSFSRIVNDESIYGCRLEDGIELKFIIANIHFHFLHVHVLLSPCLWAHSALPLDSKQLTIQLEAAKIKNGMDLS